MGSRKGMRAQEQQAREDNELSGAGAGFREPDPRPDTRKDPDTGRRSIEEPPEDESSSALSPQRDNKSSDDIPSFEDDDEGVDQENDLA